MSAFSDDLRAKIVSDVTQKYLKLVTAEALTSAYLLECEIRETYGVPELARPVKGILTKRVPFSGVTGRDIYGQEKTNAVQYFDCKQCERSIAGHRFAAHAARCSGRGRR